MRKLYITLIAAMVTLGANAAAPNSSGTYYQNANGKKGAALKTALCGIIYDRTEKSYNYLWTAFHTTDVRSDGKIWDMYSDNTNYVPGGSAQGANYSKEGDSYNREHSFPKSWFGGEVMPMYTDLHHMYPTDGYVNNKRGNYPFGETSGNTYKSHNSFSKLGTCTVSGYTGTVFEPADEYKGDFARTYFYMITCYEEKLADWYNGNADGVRATIDGSTYPGFQTWQLNMLLAWAAADPVSDKEVARNNAVYGIQRNRNPFIDYPGLEQYIWGSKTDVEFSYDNYDGSGSGSGSSATEDSYVKITSTSDLTSGQYLIVYEGGSVVFDGSLSTLDATSNNQSVTIINHTITATDAINGYAFTYDTDAHTLRSANGYYIGNTSNSNGLSSSTVTLYTNTISFDSSGNANIVGSGGAYLRYNSASDQARFRYFKSSSYSGQQAIQLYKFVEGETPSLPDPTTYSTPTAVAYDTPFTLVNGTHFTTDGTVTLTSTNPDVATVSGLTVTPKAVGECIISVTYGASSNYNASNSAFTFTVNAPEVSPTAKPSESGLLFGESFGDNSNSARVWADSYSVKNGVSAVYSGASYTVTNAKQSKNTMGQTASALVSSSGAVGTFIVGPLNVADYSNLTVSNYFGMSSGSWSSNSYMKLYYSTSTASNRTYTEVSRTDSNTPSGAVSSNSNLVQATYDLPQAAQSNTLYLKFEFYCYQLNKNSQEIGQAYLDEVQLSGSSGTPLTATLNAFGYATYCSEYPLSFTGNEDYSAWQITGVSGTSISFSQIIGSIKGGQGILLKGTAGATVTLTSADSSNELTGNLLYGTLAPTYAETDAYYGLSGNQFVKVNAGTVPAGKALLPASVVDGSGGGDVKSFTFIFDDADGIEALLDGSSEQDRADSLQKNVDSKEIYNLAGQRMSKLQRGVNIVNGKKVLVK